MDRSAWAGVAGAEPETKKPFTVDADKLAALKSAEPYRVTRKMPDYVSVITAWRAWKVVYQNGWRLQALGMSGVWEPKKAIEAECQSDSGLYKSLMLGNARQSHPAPSFNCTCGIWAFKELDSLVAAVDTQYEIKVLGQVSLWGRMIETENGYRAEKAYPSELWLMDSSLEELGLIYDVPVRSIQ